MTMESKMCEATAGHRKLVSSCDSKEQADSYTEIKSVIKLDLEYFPKPPSLKFPWKAPSVSRGGLDLLNSDPLQISLIFLGKTLGGEDWRPSIPFAFLWSRSHTCTFCLRLLAPGQSSEDRRVSGWLGLPWALRAKGRWSLVENLPGHGNY